MEKYYKEGKIRLSQEGRVLLLNGGPVPRRLPGNCMKDRVNHWNAVYGVGAMPVNAPVPGQDGGQQDGQRRDRPPHLSSNLLEVFVGCNGKANEKRKEESEEEGDEELAHVEAQLAALSAEASRLRTRKVRFVDDGKSSGKDTAGASKATVKGPVGKPPGTPAKLVAVDSGATGAKDGGKGGGGPQYRYTSKMTAEGDPLKRADELVGRMLDGQAGVTWGELGEVSMEFRKAMTERSKVHPVPLGVNLAEGGGPTVAATLAAIQKRGSRQGYSCWDNLMLRAVKPTVNGFDGYECVLDSGSQMIVVRKDVWEKVGGTLLPEEGIILETANRATVQTVGKANGLLFSFDSEVEVRLNVQVVEEAPFDVLLGRPFFAATSCVTKDHEDGKVEITLTDPSSKKKVQVRTYERVPQPLNEGDGGEDF